MQFYCYVYYDENWQAYYVGKGQDRRRQQRHNVEILKLAVFKTFILSTSGRHGNVKLN